jgi:hydrogenase-4 component B
MTTAAVFVILAGALALCALLAALAGRRDRLALGIGTAGCAAACLAGACAAAGALRRGSVESLRLSWSLPIGEFHVGIDPLSAFFLVCVFVVSGLAAVYGGGYLRPLAGRRRLAPAAAFFNLLVGAMVLLVVARDGILFLMAWEVMSIASFFLVTFESEQETVRRAGMTYLIASQVGAVFLFVLFALLAGGGSGPGAFDFDAFRSAGAPEGLADLCFLLALVGFGTKAGFWPVHIWLPDAHPAAPSHVSALMSGAMIKMGIYGLLRSLLFLGPPRPRWALALILVGAVSAITGIVQALAQRDLKRMLAYSSVENVGIIALGLGVGVLGQSQGMGGVAAIGYLGALLHVLNHGLFKGLLFQCAGSVLHATGSRDLNALGGLARRMPFTGAMLLAGSAAICALPPLNGLIGEWLIYNGAFAAGGAIGGASHAGHAIAAWAVVPTLAVAGGLAAACFVRAYGVAFLGEPRTGAVERAHEGGWLLRLPMLAGAAACAWIGLWPGPVVRWMAPAVGDLAGSVDPAAQAALLEPLAALSRVAAALLILTALIAALRAALLRGRRVDTAPTWGCGYAAPSPRMQYTSRSFAQPLLTPFATLVHARVERSGPAGFFPAGARYEEHLSDMAGERALVPASRWVVRSLSRLHVIQQGRIQLYLAYVLLTLLALLVWQLAGS